MCDEAVAAGNSCALQLTTLGLVGDMVTLCGNATEFNGTNMIELRETYSNANCIYTGSNTGNDHMEYFRHACIT